MNRPLTDFMATLHKNGVEDLRKAQVYLGWLLDTFAP